jgi:hypothetical protein
VEQAEDGELEQFGATRHRGHLLERFPLSPD